LLQTASTAFSLSLPPKVQWFHHLYGVEAPCLCIPGSIDLNRVFHYDHCSMMEEMCRSSKSLGLSCQYGSIRQTKAFLDAARACSVLMGTQMYRVRQDANTQRRYIDPMTAILLSSQEATTSSHQHHGDMASNISVPPIYMMHQLCMSSLHLARR
jgi:hypothetical protein